LKKSLVAVGIIFLVLALDQALKIWVKTHFCYGEERAILGLSWAKLNFVENPGMAFGWKFGGDNGKLALSLFRLVAIGFLIYYLSKLARSNASLGLVASFALILAGAIGNMIDSAFYGLIFSESPFHYPCQPATMFPTEGGYGKFLHGRVVDMLFFPLWKNSLGEVQFFQPVFNIADSAITTGVLSILLFQRKYFSNDEGDKAGTFTDEETGDKLRPFSDITTYLAEKEQEKERDTILGYPVTGPTQWLIDEVRGEKNSETKDEIKEEANDELTDKTADNVDKKEEDKA
jgi:signal peptidase II